MNTEQKKHLRKAMAALILCVVCISFTTVARADVGHLMPKVKEITVGNGSLSLTFPLIIDDIRQTPALSFI